MLWPNSLALTAAPLAAAPLSATPLSAWIQSAGWVLVHSAWQGAAIALLFALARAALHHSSAHARYLAGCIALAALALCPLVTACLVAPPHYPNAPLTAFTFDTVSPPMDAAEPFRDLGAPAMPAAPHERALDPAAAAALRAHHAAATPSSFHASLRAFRHRLEPALPYLVVAWLIGVVLLAARLALGWARAARWGRRGLTPLEPRWSHTLAALAQRMAIRRSVALMRSALVQVPMVVGWLKPVILLPAGALAGLTPAQIESILAHELAHIRRHDALVNLLQCLVETLLFYHPAVWWLSGNIRAERELCCDDHVLRLGLDPVLYAQTLLRLEEARATGTPGTPGSPGSPGSQFTLAASGAPLLTRVRRILAPAQPPRSLAASLFVASLAVFVLLAAAACSRMVMGDTPGPTTRPARATPAAASPATTPPPAKTTTITAARPAANPPVNVDARLAALKKLAEPLPVNFDRNKLSSALEYFKNTTGLDFDIRWDRLNEAGVQQDTPVTLFFASVRADKALSAILDSVSPATPPEKHLEFAVVNEGGVVKVSTHEDLASPENLWLLVYDVRDLAALPPTPGETADHQAMLQRLKTLICDNVGLPTDWRDRGNGYSTIEDFNNNLLIRTSPANHEQIRNLLAVIRGRYYDLTLPGMPEDEAKHHAAHTNPTAVPGAIPEADLRVLAKLREPVPINFDANKLASVIDYFRNTTGIDMTVKWDRLATAGVEQNTPVTATFAFKPVDEALRIFLSHLSPPGHPEHRLDFIVADGAVLISTFDDLAATPRLVIESYDVRDLLAAEDAVGPADTPPALQAGLAVTRLKSRICANAGHEKDWRETADGTSTIDCFAGHFIVRTTRANQQGVREFLDLLHKLAPEHKADATGRSGFGHPARTPAGAPPAAANNTGPDAQRLDAARHREQAMRETEEEVQRLLRRAADLRREQNYDKALDLLNQALFFEPDNAEAQALWVMVQASQMNLPGRDLTPQPDAAFAHPQNPATQPAPPAPASDAGNNDPDDQRRATANREADEEVQRLLRHAADLRRQQNYDDALALLDQALKLDPANQPAQAMKEMVEDFRIYVHVRDKERGPAWQFWSPAAEDADAADRLLDDPVDRRARTVLEKPISFDFHADKLTNVIGYFTNTTGLEFSLQWATLKEAGVGPDTPVTMSCKDAPAITALRAILADVSPTMPSQRLDLVITEGTLTISTRAVLFSPDFMVARSYDVIDLLAWVRRTPAHSDQERDMRAMDRLKAYLRATCGKPEDWAPRTGSSRMTEASESMLQVFTTRKSQALVDRELRQLRQEMQADSDTAKAKKAGAPATQPARGHPALAPPSRTL